MYLCHFDFPIILKSFSKLPELLPGTSLFRSQPVDKNHEKDGTFSSIKRALTSENFSQKKLKEKIPFCWLKKMKNYVLS